MQIGDIIMTELYQKGGRERFLLARVLRERGIGRRPELYQKGRALSIISVDPARVWRCPF